MIRSAASKVMWVGRATVFLVGLAVVLALLFGVTSVALGADGDFFKVGRSNLADSVSRLTKSGAGPALNLRVDSGAPLAVNSATKVTNLNADELDGVDSAGFLRTPIYDEERSTTGGAVANESAIAAIACDPGDTALSGGFSSVDNGTHLSMSRTISSSSSSTPTGSHTLTWTNNHTVDTVTLRVICADTRQLVLTR
jgi:hypothetical protein